MKVAKPWTSKDVGQAIARVSDSGTYANYGPQVQHLEERFARFFGVRSGQVAVAASGTLGLMGALATSQVSNWLLPSWTFTATPAAAVWAKKSLRFGDVTSDDWMLERERGYADEGLLPVLSFGSDIPPYTLDSTKEIVVDAAASLLSARNSLGHLPRTAAVMFSLHATKPVGVSEGAVVVFGDSDRAAQFRQWTNFGLEHTRSSETLGINAKMEEVVASLLHLSLDTVDEEIDQWQEIRSWSNDVSSELGLTQSPGLEPSLGPYWVVVFPDETTRNQVERFLADDKIETRRWWAEGCHRMQPYSHIPRGDLTVTEDIARRYLGLPFHVGLDGNDRDRIAESLANARQTLRTW